MDSGGRGPGPGCAPTLGIHSADSSLLEPTATRACCLSIPGLLLSSVPGTLPPSTIHTHRHTLQTLGPPAHPTWPPPQKGVGSQEGQGEGLCGLTEAPLSKTVLEPEGRCQLSQTLTSRPVRSHQASQRSSGHRQVDQTGEILCIMSRVATGPSQPGLARGGPGQSAVNRRALAG